MGRSYWFECSRCGYRVTVSGGPDRGPDFFVETVQCLDCRKLYDVVIKQRLTLGPKTKGMRLQMPKPPKVAPTFQAALNSLPKSNVKSMRWISFKPACPVSSMHKVEKWSDPGPCPRCGLAIEKNPLPYRIWE